MGYYYGFDPTYILVIIGAVICMLASATSIIPTESMRKSEAEAE